MKKTLQAWLDWQESLHFSAIDLGLDRIAVVAQRLQLKPVHCPLITVAGTNGKGSCVAMLNQILTEAGYKAGAYTSPHFLRYNERVAIGNTPVDDEALCAAFEAIDAARADISLTYFEFGALAAMWLFRRANVDVIILEVGLGGRLDATNLWDADIAILTSIGIDHVDWLGDDREQIAYEKASIAKPGATLVCGDADPPDQVAKTVQKAGANLLQYGRDFHVISPPTEPASSIFTVQLQVKPVVQAVPSIPSESENHASGHYAEQALGASSTAIQWPQLDLPLLPGKVQRQNAACALVALYQLRSRLPIPTQMLYQGLAKAHLTGRLQYLQKQPDIILDVAHNPEAAQVLFQWLQQNPLSGKTHALFSMLSDKDINQVVQALKPSIDSWHYFPLNSERAMPAEKISTTLQQAQVTESTQYLSIAQAWQALKPQLGKHDRVVIFGSFLVISSMLEVKL